MKIDKSNPCHWLYLTIFTANVCLALLLRLCSRKRKLGILYGHKLNGNLKAVLEYASTVPQGVELYFLTMDPVYYRRLRSEGQPALLGLNPLHMIKLAKAYVLVSDHGLHSLIVLLKFSDMKFVDVWHGIPFKGFDGNDFSVQHQYDEVWLPSERMRDLYSGRFGFDEHILHVTGYARTDVLARPRLTASQARLTFGLPVDKTAILFAPTWQQDDAQRNIFPFGVDEANFLQRMDAFCARHDAVCIVRRHLNVKAGTQPHYANIVYRGYEEYPDAEVVLLASDVLICDWSSIAFDYLLLDRPTLFLDVPPPFRKGFSLDENYRFGAVVDDLDRMFAVIEQVLVHPEQYRALHTARHHRIRAELYQDRADGRAAQRCYQRLQQLR